MQHSPEISMQGNASPPIIDPRPTTTADPAEVRVELEKILASSALRDAEMLKRLLRYVVENTLAGEGGQLKEYRLGVDVFDREDSFDPRLDPVVRMAARRLRQKLHEYYENEGSRDVIRIEVPKGSYAATFGTLASSASIEPTLSSSPRSTPRAFVWILAIILAAAGILYSVYRLRPPRAQARSRKIMLAVLPFANLSGDPQEDYFSDGITEEFIARLGNMDPSRLGVIARTSVMGYKNTGKHIDEIGRELGVQYVLEGSVRRSGPRARITAQLIQVGDQTHVWSRSYDGDSRDLLDLESRIADTAAKEVSLNLNPGGAGIKQNVAAMQKAGTPPPDPQAYELYLQGRYFWNKRSTADILKSLDYFEEAAKKDSNYAQAYVGIADAYAILAANDQAPATAVVPKAREAAEKALQLDGSVAEAHTALAHLKFFYDRDFPGAEAEYLKALELNPGSADTHHFYGVMLMWIGRVDEAAEQLRQSQVLDPLAPANSSALGLDYLFSGKNNSAMEQARRILEIAPNDAIPHALLGFCYERKRMYSEAVAEMQEGVTLSHRDSEMLGYLGWVLGRAGRRDEARSILAELVAPHKERYSAAHDIAIVYAGLGDKENALRYLAQALTKREADVLNIKMETAWEPLHNDSRFQALLRRSGLSG